MTKCSEVSKPWVDQDPRSPLSVASHTAQYDITSIPGELG